MVDIGKGAAQHNVDPVKPPRQRACVLQAFTFAFRQLPERRLLAVFAHSLAVTLTVFAGVGVALYFALAALFAQWSGPAVTVLAVVVDVALLWLTFRAVAIGVIGAFGDRVVHAVEARYYPDALATARPVPLARAAAMGAKSVARLVGYNLLATPLYLVGAATGIGLPTAFFALNGWLLGRDLGDMVAVRHLDRAELIDWRTQTRWQRLALGLAVGGLFVVPVVNFVAPVIGAAAMTHLFHRERRMQARRT